MASNTGPPGCAWGGGMFESEFDIGMVIKLSSEVGANLNVKNPEPVNEYTSWPPSEEELVKTRAHLNNGIFDRIFDKHQNSDKIHEISPTCKVRGSYLCILLATSAMKFGARITQEQKDYIRSKYKSAGLMAEGIEQVGRALDEYKTGVPYDLIKPDRSEARAAKKREIKWARETGAILTRNHFGARYHAEDAPTPDDNSPVKMQPFMRATLEAARRPRGTSTETSISEALEGPTGYVAGIGMSTGIFRTGTSIGIGTRVSTGMFTSDGTPFGQTTDTTGLTCDDCGKPDSPWIPLKKCAKCKRAFYCDRECQKKGWKAHKKVCASLAASNN